MKYVVFLGDGMADTPVPSLGGVTPLDKAKHPAMDYMAGNGVFGLTKTVPEGMKPGSDTANLSVFGYDPKECYTGRSPLEAASIGVRLDDADVTYRCNFVTLTAADALENASMEDYSAGEISSDEARELVDVINREFGSELLHLYPGVSYRQCLVLKNAQTGAELVQPHDIPGQSVGDKLPGGTNAALLLKMMQYAYRTFPDHPVNRRRIAEGKRPANCVWFWGEGRKPRLGSFLGQFGISGAVVSAVDLIQGIGKCAGLEVLRVEGATGNYHTNYTGKAEAAIDAFRRGLDYVYIHVEAPDECGHRGEIPEKVYAIEQIDQRIVRPVLEYLESTKEDYAALLMPDHPTPIAVRTHTSDPVPFVLYYRGDQGKQPRHYCEREAVATGVFVPRATQLLPMMLRREKCLQNAEK